MNYAQRLKQEKEDYFYAGLDTGIQRAMDFMCMALNDPDCMGAKNVLSGEKINAICEYAMQLSAEHKLAFRTKHVEADVWQERIDAKQRKIFKDKFQPFKVRYPYIKDVKYE